MTPKENAQKIVDDYTQIIRWKMVHETVIDKAKQCAILAVKERIAECQLWRDSQEGLTDWELNRLDFLYEVIDEIDKIV